MNKTASLTAILWPFCTLCTGSMVAFDIDYNYDERFNRKLFHIKCSSIEMNCMYFDINNTCNLHNKILLSVLSLARRYIKYIKWMHYLPTKLLVYVCVYVLCMHVCAAYHNLNNKSWLKLLFTCFSLKIEKRLWLEEDEEYHFVL